MKNTFPFVCSLVVFSMISFHGLSQNNAIKTIGNGRGNVYAIDFTPHGSAIAMAENNAIIVYSSGGGPALRQFNADHKNTILSLDISSDSLLIVSGGKDSMVILNDFITGKIIDEIICRGIVTSVAFSDDNKYLAFSTTTGRVSVFDIHQNKTIWENDDQTKDISSVTFSHDSKWLATAGGDKMIRIYDMSGKIASILSGHKNWVREVSFSPDSKNLLSCGDDSRVLLWDLKNLSDVSYEKINRGFTWVLCTDCKADNKAIGFGHMGGKIVIKLDRSTYSYKIGVPVTRVLFKPGLSSSLVIAVATMGKGVIILNGRNMKFRSKI